MNERVLAVLRRAFMLSTRILWVVSRVAVMALVFVVTVVVDPTRRRTFQRWFLLEGGRMRIAGWMTGVVVVSTFTLGMLGVLGVEDRGFVTSMFGGVISGLFSFVPIVVAVNQLTVSQLFGSPEQLRDEIRSVRSFRSSIEGRLPNETVAPTEPAAFLSDVLGLVLDRVYELRAVVGRDGTTDQRRRDLQSDVDTYVRTVETQSEEIERQLDGTHQRLIAVLVPMMGDSYSRNVTDARRLAVEFEDVLSARAGTLLAELRELFVSMDVLRQYFKALYVQQELANLSRLIAYSGIASFLTSVFLILLFARGEPLVGHVFLELLISVSLGIAFSPFAILVSYMIRIATIVKRTTAPGAFTPARETPEYREIDRSYD
ncbi:hypothetical protein [Halomarina oriensis]|uniref:Uncharacterized protein n=1 Tax=Halomarina oriensis TaxID=671145 RepID=A0A6B0GJN5_9EURY|nr:hypothetical protein [Halomarina oriensis]MWG33023.1 hypothetical protein [Halomarina oriensis]